MAANVSVLLQGVGLALLSPLTTRSIGSSLNRILDLGQIDTFLGHVAYLGAACAALHHVLSRVTANDAELSRAFWFGAWPAVLTVPVLAVLLVGMHPRHCTPWGDQPLSVCLVLYRVVLAATMLWLMLFGIWVLRIARTDPRSRMTANMQIVAAAFGIALCVVNAIGLFPTLWWLLLFAANISYARSVSRSWRYKLASYSRRLAVVEPDEEPA